MCERVSQGANLGGGYKITVKKKRLKFTLSAALETENRIELRVSQAIFRPLLNYAISLRSPTCSCATHVYHAYRLSACIHVTRISRNEKGKQK